MWIQIHSYSKSIQGNYQGLGDLENLTCYTTPSQLYSMQLMVEEREAVEVKDRTFLGIGKKTIRVKYYNPYKYTQPIIIDCHYKGKLAVWSPQPDFHMHSSFMLFQDLFLPDFLFKNVEEHK